ncbi:Integrin beta-PS, partial [Stegodyphus mimosarum]
MDRNRTRIYLSKHIVFTLLIIQNLKHEATANQCLAKETCSECITESPLCAWCWQEDFSGTRCDFTENLRKVCNNVVSPNDEIKKLKDMNLSDKGAKESEAIQVKPQEIRLKLRPNSVMQFKLEFRQAVDYPVDLYYLMDLSNSMADDKDKLAELGNKLAAEMGTITNNFRLGFGSFVDKTTAPYVNVHPERLREPCAGCAAPYGFHNDMPLSSKTHEFARKVKATPVSGNLDAPEGGLDAIMQAIVCKDEIGWRNKSRKLLVFSTDNGFHYAGDGKLGGIISPNDEQCHLDSRGSYTKSTELDYPSLSQIKNQVKKNYVNIIFAVTSDQVKLYEKLSRLLTGSSTGKLENDSSNVVDLVRQQYDKITSSVELTDNNNDPNIRISYYSKCLGNTIEKTNVCKGLKVGTHVTFEISIEYTFCPQDPSQWNRTFQIYPVGVPDQLILHLEMICECECEKPKYQKRNSLKCSDGKGTFQCGICDCYNQTYGSRCECDGLDSHSSADVNSCYNGDDTKPCSGQGTCVCGKCECFTRQNPDEKIYGKYCECNNFSCDKFDGKFCNGKDHGVCDCGLCKCLSGWTGENCGCRDSTTACMSPNGEMCSGHGSCECGICKCDTSEQEYFGRYCDDCATCPGMCDELQECVECWVRDQKGENLNCTSCGYAIVRPIENIKVGEMEKQCSFEDKEKCRYTFKYSFDDMNRLLVFPKMKLECPEPINVVAIVSGVSGGVVATGLFLLMLWKILTTIHDRRELAKFEKERLMAKWQEGENPIYIQATSTFQNPAYGGD